MGGLGLLPQEAIIDYLHQFFNFGSENGVFSKYGPFVRVTPDVLAHLIVGNAGTVFFHKPKVNVPAF